MKRHNHVQCPQPQSSLQLGSGMCLPWKSMWVSHHQHSLTSRGWKRPPMYVPWRRPSEWPVWQECSGPSTCVIPLSPSATCFRFLRKPEQHKNQPCSAAASLLLEGLKGFHLQMCPCRRSTAASPPCLRYRQTENAEAQGHQLCPQPVPTPPTAWKCSKEADVCQDTKK